MALSSLLAYIGAIFSTIAVLPQIIKVIRIKEAHAISYLFLGLRMVAFVLFMSAGPND